MFKKIKVRKIKTENAPIIIVGFVIIILVIVALVSPYIQSHSSKSESSNYQLAGTIDTTTFMIERVYTTEDNLVVESRVDVSDKESIDSKSVYYKLGTESSNDVLSQGYLTPDIEVGIDTVPKASNIVINLYAIVDSEDLETAEPSYRVIVDSDEILKYIDIKSYLKDYSTLSEDDKLKMTQYVSMNYMNKNLKSSYSTDVQNLFKDFIKTKDIKKKQKILDELIKEGIDHYNYYSDVANLLGEDFDELINNSLSIESNYYKSKAITESIKYLDEAMLDKIESMERELTERKVNLDEYNELKQSYPLKDRYEYLDKLMDENPKEKPKEKVESKDEKPVVEEPMVEEPVVEEPMVEEPVVEEPMVEEPVVEEPTVEEPVVEEPTVEEPVVEEPAVEEPSNDLCYPTNGDANNEAVNQMINDDTIAGFEIDGNNCIVYKYY